MSACLRDKQQQLYTTEHPDLMLHVLHVGKLSLDGSVNQRLDQLDKRETELLQKIEEQNNLVKKLKDDRAYYRTKCDEKEYVFQMIFTLLMILCCYCHSMWSGDAVVRSSLANIVPSCE